MNKITRIAIASAALTAGLAVTGASQAKAGIEIGSVLNAGHSRTSVSIRIGHPSFVVGAYVPRGYRVYNRPNYGYGFTYRNRWIPVRQYRSTWRVCDRPYVAYGGGYDRHDRYSRHDRYDRDDRWSDQCNRYDRSHRRDRNDRWDDDRARNDDRHDRDRWDD